MIVKDYGRRLCRYACFNCRVALKNVKKCPECHEQMMAMDYNWKPPLKTQKKKWEESKRFITHWQMIQNKPNFCPLPYQFIPKRIKNNDSR